MSQVFTPKISPILMSAGNCFRVHVIVNDDTNWVTIKPNDESCDV